MGPRVCSSFPTTECQWALKRKVVTWRCIVSVIHRSSDLLMKNHLHRRWVSSRRHVALVPPAHALWGVGGRGPSPVKVLSGCSTQKIYKLSKFFIFFCLQQTPASPDTSTDSQGEEESRESSLTIQKHYSCQHIHKYNNNGWLIEVFISLTRSSIQLALQLRLCLGYCLSLGTVPGNEFGGWQQMFSEQLPWQMTHSFIYYLSGQRNYTSEVFSALILLMATQHFCLSPCWWCQKKEPGKTGAGEKVLVGDFYNVQ